MEAMPESDYDALVRDVLAYRDTLKHSGHYVASSPLQPVRTATTIRVRHGQTFLTDGPFAETKEQLAGFYLIEAADLNDAIRLAAKMPPARFGTIEVRPLADLTADDEARAAATARS
ncbi:MAG TPA: YciI family protein, partial [Thermomicrobiales bacterium]|nr:YciI family protein [Thermomicrobiales bacterium]